MSNNDIKISGSVSRSESILTLGTPTDKEASESSKEGFSSRWAFWLSAIGCSVGFGNVWRFPYLCYDYGGLAFFVPYIFGLIFVVFPTFTLEMGISQMVQGGHIRSFAALGKYCRGIGMTTFTAFNICLYYPLLLAWTSVFFVNSFKSSMPWAVSDDEKLFCSSIGTDGNACSAADLCKWHPTQNTCVVNLLYKATNFFHDSCYAYDDFANGEHLMGFVALSGGNVAGFFAAWTFNFLALVAGAKVLGYIMYVTMTLPSVFLITLVIVGLTLEGSDIGIKQYIAKFETSKIAHTQAWMDAIGQGVFSVGVAQGTAAAYSAHNDRKQNFVQDAFVVVVADTVYAFLAGFSVFAVVGYLAFNAGESIDTLPLSGITLAFATYPVGLSIIPGVGANIFCVLFFMTLWLLGMDTLVALTEANVLIVMESRFGRRMNFKRWMVTLVICVFFFVGPGLLLSTNLGYCILDSLDTYSTSVTQVFAAGSEAAVVGWIYLNRNTIKKCGLTAYAIHASTFFIGIILMGILGKTVGAAASLPTGFILVFGGFGLAVYFCKKEDEEGRSYSIVDRMYYLSLYNIEPLRILFNQTACHGSKWRLPKVWSFTLKYITPSIVFYFFISSLLTPAVMYSRPGGNGLDIEPYPWYIFLMGQLTPFGIVIFFSILFTIFPHLMNPLLPPGQEEIPILGEEFLCEAERKGHSTLSVDDANYTDVVQRNNRRSSVTHPITDDNSNNEKDNDELLEDSNNNNNDINKN